MSTQQGLPLIHDRYTYVEYILPGFVTGVYASACFGGMVISEGIRVLYRFPQDSTILRVMVMWVMACSLLHTRSVVICQVLSCQHDIDSVSSLIYLFNSWFEYIAYHYAVDGFHDVRQLNTVTPHLGAHVFLSRCLVTTCEFMFILHDFPGARRLTSNLNLAQLFFCYRLYVFSSRDWRGTSLAILLTLGHVASAIGTMIQFVRAKYYTELFPLLPLGFLYSTTISGDVLITGSLLYYLGKQKTHYIKTKSIIKRIMLLSFQTSFLTTALAIVSIGLLGAQRELGILYCLTLISAQLYLLSILVTLNSRFDFAKAFAEDANKSLSRSFRMNFLKSKTREWPGPGEGVSIQVDQVIFTDFDEDILVSPRFTKVRPGNGQHTIRSPAVPILDNFANR
ncbi:hypothetical protein PTTG_05763 [Puccinia triticina 1-1 BBBD Race 1]|uniref:DUF6534 domain-containing protein n=1 Tax=Puccinia triticina (isolate 1-1 / race 1 (BBBD)) TaxID=630390 RepID=A0A0C4EY64_PUCT1|nr:hypothetical protein PTTG_05763 [Puccinia triticina 1-1 BBBD Race 1]